MSVARSLPRRACRVLALVGALVAAGACRPTGKELAPPQGAAPFRSREAPAFNDAITVVPVRMVGRAPGDVQDQRLFAERLGYSSLVVMVEVIEAWERRRPGKADERFVEVRLGEPLLHEIPKRTRPEQTLVIRSEDPLPPGLQGRQFILFLRWAPGERPGYHHHLMVANDEVVDLVRAMVRHAEATGNLEPPRGARRERRRGKRAGGGAASAATILEPKGGLGLPMGALERGPREPVRSPEGGEEGVVEG